MAEFADNFYARWRSQTGPGPILQEGRGDAPPEQLLQAIWQNQRLLVDQLRLLDGQPVRILHPGFRNREAGPDFRGAVVRIGSALPITGDIEIDLEPGGWTAHGHDQNPNFRGVILQVIWSGDRPVAGTIPILPLRGKLDAPLAELADGLGRESAGDLVAAQQGRCCSPLGQLVPARQGELLQAAAQVRFRNKAGQLAARARQAGWEQALWEGLFRALGYKQNVWPLKQLAELRPEWSRATRDAFSLQVRLLGLSGLLPDQLSRTQKDADGYIRQVWDQWWRERDEWADRILPRSIWRLHGIRPANHPQRRLALAAHWLAAGDLPAKLEHWFTRNLRDSELVHSLEETLQITQDEFWSRHWTLRSAPLAKPQPLLGAGRVTDLAINVILPWLWIRTVEGKNDALRKIAEHRYCRWPAAEDNSVLRLARRRLFGGLRAVPLPTAAAQQGLLQIVRDFCDHSNALCEQCQFPQLVRDWAGLTGTGSVRESNPPV